MADLFDLAKQMEEVASNVPMQMAQLKANVAKKMVEYLILNTPVNTTQALSNWQVSWGSPERSTRSAYVEGKGGETWELSTEEATLQANLVLSSPVQGRDLYITNNIGYIDALNAGKSKQGKFFVEEAEVLGQDAVDVSVYPLPASL
jgi:hypothetical protein